MPAILLRKNEFSAMSALIAVAVAPKEMKIVEKPKTNAKAE
jgi:hypothetical protein